MPLVGERLAVAATWTWQCSAAWQDVAGTQATRGQLRWPWELHLPPETFKESPEDRLGPLHEPCCTNEYTAVVGRDSTSGKRTFVGELGTCLSGHSPITAAASKTVFSESQLQCQFCQGHLCAARHLAWRDIEAVLAKGQSHSQPASRHAGRLRMGRGRRIAPAAH